MSVRVALAAVIAALLAMGVGPTAQAALPGSNGKIAFVSDRDPNGIFLLSNGNETVLDMSASGYFGSTHEPAWSPDGGKIAAWRGTVLTINEDGTGLNEAPEVGLERNFNPTWSPDGSEIAHAADGEDCVFPEGCAYFCCNIRIRTADFTSHRLLPHRMGPDPMWSPDGTRIATEDEDGRYSPFNIVTASLDGQAIVDTGFHGEDPDWSPDAKQLAYTRQVGAKDEIFVGNLATGIETRLTTNSVDDRHPAWSPDGRKIVFDSDEGGDREIFVMNVDGSGRQQLTDNAADDHDPSWQPLGAFANYPRPASATPTRFPLVPAFARCTTPDSVHVAPLSLPACSSTSQVSDLLTTSTGRGSGHVLLRAALGNPSTPEDEADILMRAQATDVVCRGAGPGCASAGADYTGQLLFALEGTRITDKSSGFGEVSATAADFTFSAPVSCTPTGGATGSNCLLNTTADALVPGAMTEEKRTVLRVENAHLLDAGADGATEGSSCPPTCGTGDEKVFLEQGVFTP